MKNFILLTLFLLTSSSAYAGTCSSIGCTGKITSIYIVSDKTTYISMDGDKTPLGCTLQAGVYFTITGTEPSYNVWIATLLAAQATNADVNLRSVEGSNGCTLYYIVKQ